jgi:hypothetical protein
MVPGKRLTELSELTAKKLVYLVQLVFALISFIGVDGPFVNVHFERQNQTFDVARHVFQIGFEGVVVPEASFSKAPYSELPFTHIHYEVPFFGLIGWPFEAIFGHERAVVRLIAVAFSLVSIFLIFRILRHWLEPAISVLGAAIWGFAPLVLHFGQVPMPDILCTTGIMLGFYLALRAELAGSSIAFAFAILAKASVIVFGLPVLIALFVAMNIRTPFEAVRNGIIWGATPVVALIGWVLIGVRGPSSEYTLLYITNNQRGPLSDLMSPSFYFQSLGTILPFGLGIIGVVGLIFSTYSDAARMSRWIKVAIILSCSIYFAFVVRKILEPQYFLPLLFWLVIAASFGFPEMLRKLGPRRWWRLVIVSSLAAHILVVGFFINDLKTSRVPDYPAIQRAAKLLPNGSRVLVVDLNYRAAPAVWLDRNVETTSGNPSDLEKNLPYLESINFGYLITLDLDSRHRRTSFTSQSSIIGNLRRALTGRQSPDSKTVSHTSSPTSPTRQFCDAHFQRLFDSPFVVLYKLPLTREPVASP